MFLLTVSGFGGGAQRLQQLAWQLGAGSYTLGAGSYTLGGACLVIVVHPSLHGGM